MTALQITPVILGVWKRARGEPIYYGPFQLGRWRNILNIVAIIYTVFACMLLFFPTAPAPTPVSMNWSIVLVGGVLVFAVFWWFVSGKRSFDGPDVDAKVHGPITM